jgi:hypothetical protein
MGNCRGGKGNLFSRVARCSSLCPAISGTFQALLMPATALIPYINLKLRRKISWLAPGAILGEAKRFAISDPEGACVVRARASGACARRLDRVTSSEHVRGVARRRNGDGPNAGGSGRRTLVWAIFFRFCDEPISAGAHPARTTAGTRTLSARTTFFYTNQ